jgi:hypothetical protein
MHDDAEDEEARGERESRRRPPPGPLESLFQEAIRRATGLGISGLASTEEAVRKAVNERVPPDWLRFLSEQGGELRKELLERIAAEFGAFLRSPELDAKLRRLLDDYELRISLRRSADPRQPGQGAIRFARRDPQAPSGARSEPEASDESDPPSGARSEPEAGEG